MTSTLFSRVKCRLRNSTAYLLAREIKRHALSNGTPQHRVASLKPPRASRGNVLLSYVSEPFHLKPGQPVPHSHTNCWESLQMARTFLDLGYSVDVIDWRNLRFLPRKPYAIVVDSRHNLERLTPFLAGDCLRIMHVDTSHILFHDTAECRRLLALQQRRGVTLRMRRYEMPNLGIEHAHCATVLGNDVTLSTFRYANKPLYPIPISTAVLYPWPEQKDFARCKRRFLWFGSGGMVHKGLDLVLEAFAQMPQFHLTVCGPVQREHDFERCYYDQLYRTANIHTVGWVDTASATFAQIARDCVALIYPSCSEGQAGCVVTCMHAGIIPLISRESGVDVAPDYGVLLGDCSIEEIRQSVETIASLPDSTLQEMARRAWEFARTHHTREIFAQSYRRAMEAILAAHGQQAVPTTAVDQGPPQPRSVSPARDVLQGAACLGH